MTTVARDPPHAAGEGAVAAGAGATAVRVEMVTDTQWPHGFLAKRAFELATETGAAQGLVMEYVRRPFILRPERVGQHNWKDVLQKLGASRGNPGWMSQFVPAMIERGRELGLAMSFGGDVGNSMDSLRLLHHAGAVSSAVQESLACELALAQFTREECMGDVEVLQACAAKVGLDAAAVQSVLGDPTMHRDAVVRDIDNAHDEGVYSIPVFRLHAKGRMFQLEGARSVEEYASALNAVAAL